MGGRQEKETRPVNHINFLTTAQAQVLRIMTYCKYIQTFNCEDKQHNLWSLDTPFSLPFFFF